MMMHGDAERASSLTYYTTLGWTKPHTKSSFIDMTYRRFWPQLESYQIFTNLPESCPAAHTIHQPMLDGAKESTTHIPSHPPRDPLWIHHPHPHLLPIDQLQIDRNLHDALINPARRVVDWSVPMTISPVMYRYLKDVHVVTLPINRLVVDHPIYISAPTPSPRLAASTGRTHPLYAFPICTTIHYLLLNSIILHWMLRRLRRIWLGGNKRVEVEMSWIHCNYQLDSSLARSCSK